MPLEPLTLPDGSQRSFLEDGDEVVLRGAGGVATGRQMAAAMTMGADGVWTGSVWLATGESETTEIFREKMIAASKLKRRIGCSVTSAAYSGVKHRSRKPPALARNSRYSGR